MYFYYNSFTSSRQSYITYRQVITYATNTSACCPGYVGEPPECQGNTCYQDIIQKDSV